MFRVFFPVMASMIPRGCEEDKRFPTDKKIISDTLNPIHPHWVTPLHFPIVNRRLRAHTHGAHHLSLLMGGIKKRRKEGNKLEMGQNSN